MDETAREDVVVLPPIPLATGSVVLDDTGRATAVGSITVLIRTVDGREIPISLVHRHGAWWQPDS